MNIVQLQDRLKGLSQEQLVQEMQMPTGQVPQFLVLSELTRRKKMEDSYAMERGREQTTVAQDAVNAAGMPAPFAAQMSGTMAPQTNIAGNTAAMPQQRAMPPKRMAGGGIVALRDGGEVSPRPQLVVQGGRQYARMADGSLIPLSELGFSPADLSGAGTPDLVSPYGETVQQGPIPTQADLDMKASLGYNDALGILRTPAQLPDYAAPDLANFVIPGTDSGVAVNDPSVLGSISPDMLPGRIPTSRFDIGDLTPAQLEAYNSLSPEEQENVELYGAPGIRSSDPIFGGATSAVEEALGADPFSPGMSIPEAVRAYEDWEQGGDGPSVRDTLSGRAVTTEVEADDAVRSEETSPEPAPEKPAPVTPPEVKGEPKSPPSSGGIASVAAQGAPSDYEQELLNMLQSREKRAEQDKWLALAQAGMALMSSKSPTFGGALGEAGQVGLGALREGQSTSEADRLALLGQLEQSRMGREKLALERQALAARAAGGGGSVAKVPAGLITPLIDRLDKAQEELSMLPPIPEAGVFGQKADPYSDRRLQLANEVGNLQQQLNMLYFTQTGGLAAPFGGDVGIPNLSD